jgi:hypothetical protein
MPPYGVDVVGCHAITFEPIISEELLLQRDENVCVVLSGQIVLLEGRFALSTAYLRCSLNPLKPKLV